MKKQCEKKRCAKHSWPSILPKTIGIAFWASLVLVCSLFSLPTAIAVNLIGGIIMSSIPFWIGKRFGAKRIDHLAQRNPKLELLRTLPQKNEWFVSFFVRIVGGLPGDLVSMYLGSSNLRYIRYICGTMTGLLPSIIIFTVMGMSIDDVSSPAFKISIGCKIGLTALSLILYFIWEKRKGLKTP